MIESSFRCRSCAEEHAGPPFSYGSDAPAVWSDEFSSDDNSELSDERCVIRGEHFFVRARILLPVVDADVTFDWGVWTTLSEANFQRMSELWTTPGREAEPHYFGWLSTELPGYEPSTLWLKCHVLTQPVGERPVLRLEPTDHPLAVEQRDGISTARVREFAELLLHP